MQKYDTVFALSGVIATYLWGLRMPGITCEEQLVGGEGTSVPHIFTLAGRRIFGSEDQHDYKVDGSIA